MVNLNNITLPDIIGVNDDNKPKVVGSKSLVLNYLRQYPDGVTAQMVAEQANISADRARNILKELVLTRDAYSRKLPGIKEMLYYPNGKLLHKYLQDSREIEDQIFRISFHEGRRNPRIQVQERKFTLLEGESVEGSIFIDVDNVWAFIEFFNEMMSRYNTFNSEGKHED